MVRTLATQILLGSFLLPLGAAHAQSKRDAVWLQGETKALSGKILNVRPDEISMEVGGKPQLVTVDSIDRIRLSDDPTGMANVRSSVQAGQFEQAATQLRSVKPTGRAITKQDVAFHSVLTQARLALLGTGNVTDAAREVGTFIKDYPSSFRYYAACELMGDLAMSLGRFDSAVKYYARVGKSKSSKLTARAQLLQGHAWQRKGDYAKATSLYRVASRTGDLRVKNLATVGLAACAATAGNAEQAIRNLEKIIQENDASDFELFAKAYNAMGLAYGQLNQKEAALDAYLHTHLLFYREHDAHAEALFHLTSLWKDLNQLNESKRARQTLKQRFAGSDWARKL